MSLSPAVSISWLLTLTLVFYASYDGSLSLTLPLSLVVTLFAYSLSLTLVVSLTDLPLSSLLVIPQLPFGLSPPPLHSSSALSFILILTLCLCLLLVGCLSLPYSLTGFPQSLVVSLTHSLTLPPSCDGSLSHTLFISLTRGLSPFSHDVLYSSRYPRYSHLFSPSLSFLLSHSFSFSLVVSLTHLCVVSLSCLLVVSLTLPLSRSAAASPSRDGSLSLLFLSHTRCVSLTNSLSLSLLLISSPSPFHYFSHPSSFSVVVSLSRCISLSPLLVVFLTCCLPLSLSFSPARDGSLSLFLSLPTLTLIFSLSLFLTRYPSHSHERTSE